MIEILKPTQDKLGLGHLFKKREFYPQVYHDDFKGKLIICENPCISGSNEHWEAQHLYMCNERFITSPIQGKYYVARCENMGLDEKIFKFVSYYNDKGLVNLCVEGKDVVSTITIFNKCFEVIKTTDEKLINDGVVKIDDYTLKFFVDDFNQIAYKPQEPVSDEVKALIRPYMLQLVHDVADYVENYCSTGNGSGFDLDKWMEDNIK